MDKKRIANSLSAFVLLAFAVIWLVYLCAGDRMDPVVAQRLSMAVSLLSLVTYVIKLVFSYNIMPKWLVIILMIAMFGTIPATLIDVLQASGIDLTLFPLIRDIFYISQKITYIVLYIVLIANACQLTESWIFRIVFVIIGLFLIFCVVVEWIPSIAEHLPVPLIGFKGAVKRRKAADYAVDNRLTGENRPKNKQKE